MSDENTTAPAVAVETVVPETVPATAVEEQKHDVDYADEEANGAVS
jgi:hypothetical protein